MWRTKQPIWIWIWIVSRQGPWLEHHINHAATSVMDIVLLSPVYSDTTQLNSTSSWVELSCELSRFGHPLRRTTPIADGRWAARSQSVLSRSVRCLEHSFCCYSSISLFSSSSVQLSRISIRPYSHTNSRISWLFCIIHDVMTHKLTSTGSRRSTQLDVELSWVELCRYKRGFRLLRIHKTAHSVGMIIKAVFTSGARTRTQAHAYAL